MKFTIPIYVEAKKGSGRGQTFAVRPLFFPSPQRSGEKLERALQRLTEDLRERLIDLGREFRHDELARWTFSPPLETCRLDLDLLLRRRTARLRLFFVTFEALGRRLAFSPGVPEAWFELGRGEKLQERATEALTAHFRQLEKEEEEGFVPPEECGLQGTAWVTPLELYLRPAQRLAETGTRFAMLGTEAPLDGGWELRRVGRCLDHLYPDDLDRIVLRQTKLEELTRLLTARDRRPVLLVGLPLVGKTALLHEFVYRAVTERRRDRADAYRNNVWLLAPQRLISGMSFVGQWENRLLAIIAEARDKNHLLYFDDLLGLYHAGQTSQSDLSIAHVLRPYVERRDVRLVAEITPESLRVLRERDRGFADLFHVLPVEEPGEQDTLRILIQVMRQLEPKHRARFRLDVLPTVLDLTRRYVRHLSFPGKAAVFLRRLAVKYRNGEVSRTDALVEFHEQSGLSMTFLDSEQKLDRLDVLAALGKEIIGQPRALEASADVIGVAKARLNDPDRPLASFLFLGPTGVGKTQCAKAVARFLFGDAERLLRFDMNEFLTPGSAARLAGTFDQPEGLLTAAVRRRPFAVVLFDEIEKAHPEVFDLLLQVLGEGRLSDALGRTVDFTSTLIILTSNLGVREAQQGPGFAVGDGHRPEAYTQAAQRFFRPEFFNRLDRIVPFDRLGREDVSRIARLLIQDVLLREGLVRRKCVLRVEPAALERIVDEGFDPVLGARALKRAIERQLAQPVARRLAAGLPETITLINIYPGRDSVCVDVRGLVEVERLPADHRVLGRSEEVIRGVVAALRRIEERFAHLRPTGAIDPAGLEGEHAFYFVVQERVRDLRQRARELAEMLEDSRRSHRRGPSLPVPAQRDLTKEARTSFDGGPRYGSVLAELAAAEDIRLFLEEMAQRARPFGSAEEAQARALAEDVAVLETLADSVAAGEEQVLLYLWTANPGGLSRVEELARRYAAGFLRALGRQADVADGDSPTVAWWGLEQTVLPLPTDRPERALLVRGLAATRLTAGEVGTHLFVPEQIGLIPVQVHAWPVPEGVDALAVLSGHTQARRTWLEALARGNAALADDPLLPGPVVRIYNEGRQWLDLRTGRVGSGLPPIAELVTATLPLPAEVR